MTMAKRHSKMAIESSVQIKDDGAANRRKKLYCCTMD